MEINFTSTRNHKLQIPFWPSVVQGIAPDGGLLVPTHLPKFSPKLINSQKFWQSTTTSHFSTLLHRLFIPQREVSDRDLKQAMQRAHNFDLPLLKLDDTTYILQIDTGPTASFKDIAARSLAVLLERYCDKHKTVINIVVATSGDTGVAIAAAFGGSGKITVSILYPNQGVSEIQEKQMLDVAKRYSNIQAIAVRGNFDHCQDIAKLLQGAREVAPGNGRALQSFIKEVKEKIGQTLSTTAAQKLIEMVGSLHLSSANSINIWRLIPQMTQYFVAYSKLVKLKQIKAGEPIVFAVPSGNVGHLMAGLYAQAIGLPVKRFIVGTNANNILANIVGSGMIKHRQFTKTSSPSMDILDPSNLERLLSFAAYKTKTTTPINFLGIKKDIKHTTDLDRAKRVAEHGITDKMLAYIQSLIWAEDIETDEEIYAMMLWVTKTHQVVLEPHGITALIATIRARAKEAVSKDDVVVVFETAHPDKFPTALAAAGLTVPKQKHHPALKQLARRSLASFPKDRPLGIDLVAVAKKIKQNAY